MAKAMTERQKVLHVAAMAERGGLEVVLLNILKCLDRSRFTPLVLCLENGPFVREVEETATQTHVIEAGRVREMLRVGRTVAKAVRLIRNEAIDVVHSHNAKAHIYGGLAAAVAGIPSLYHLHGVPRPAASRDGVVSLLSVTVPAQRTVACSEYVAAGFRRVWHSRRRLVVIHNGVLSGASTTGGTLRVREEFGIPDGAPIVLMAARLQRGKGVHVFLDAAVHVARNHPGVCFVIVGGALFGLGEEYTLQLHQQVDRLKLTRAVRFLGFQSDVLRLYSAADLVVQSPIEPEAFGMVLVEAMACGRPVIASDSGASREIVESGVTGLLVPPGDAEQLGEAILTLLGDRERRLRMGQAGAARVRELFSAERMVRRLETVYQEMVRKDSTV